MNFFKNALTFLIFIFVFNITTAAFAYEPAAVARYNEGIDLSKKGDYQFAINAFKKAVAIDPTFTDAYYNLGSLYEYLNDTDNAIIAFQHLLRNNPKDSEAAYHIAQLYYKKADYKNSISYITLVPADSSEYNNTQNLYRKIVQKLNTQTAANQPVQQKTPAQSTMKVVLKDFQGPTGVAKDRSGNIYVACFGDNSIIKVTPDGRRFLVAKGQPLNGPIGIVVDDFGNIYVANYNANQVLKITPQGSVSEIVKNIVKPYYLFLDDSGMLYISEQGTNTIIKFRIL